MKRFLIVGGLLLAAGILIAASVSHTLPAAGDATINGYSIQVVYDSTDAHDKVNNDTVLSNVLDVSPYSRFGVYMNLGNVTVCDSCNDSIKIFVETLMRGATSTQWYKVRTDTMGGNNIAVTFDDSTKTRFVNLDSLPANELMFRTIIRDSLKQYTVPSTANNAGVYTTLVPLHYVVVGR